jgi:hypothetical protein
MSRFAYPASSSREDVCFHGSAESHAEVTKMILKEKEEGRMLGLLRLGHTHTSGDLIHGFRTRSRIGAIYIADPFPTNFPVCRNVNVTTRSGVIAKGDNSDASSSPDEVASLSSPPPAAGWLAGWQNQVPNQPSSYLEPRAPALFPSHPGAPGEENYFQYQETSPQYPQHQIQPPCPVLHHWNPKSRWSKGVFWMNLLSCRS